MTLSSIWKSINSYNDQSVKWVSIHRHNFHVPRFSFIAWLALHRRHSTSDRLQHFNLQVDTFCVLCNSVITHEHLFFACFTLQVIRNTPLPYDFNWNSLVLMLQSSSNNLVNNIMRLFFAAMIYFIWRERNNGKHVRAHCHAHVITEFIKLCIRNKRFSSKLIDKHIKKDMLLLLLIY